MLLFDYRGYGGNPGRPSEEGLAQDVRAAHRFLTDEGEPGERLLYYGESLGAAVVAELATQHQPAGLVLRSPFTDLASVGQIHYPFLPVRALLKDRYPVAEYVARVTAPITVVYGTEDSIVPPEESRRSVAGARGPIRLVAVEGVDHNDPALLNGNALMQAVMELANEINRAVSPQPEPTYTSLRPSRHAHALSAHRSSTTKIQHLDDAAAAVDLKLTESEVACLEQPCVPRQPTYF